MSGLIVKLENDVFAEIFQRNFCAKTGTEPLDLIGPVLELWIVGNTTLKRDRRIFGEARRFAAAARIASFAMLDNFSRTPQSLILLTPAT